MGVRVLSGGRLNEKLIALNQYLTGAFILKNQKHEVSSDDYCLSKFVVRGDCNKIFVKIGKHTFPLRQFSKLLLYFPDTPVFSSR
jgi:hypothetical protein